MMLVPRKSKSTKPRVTVFLPPVIQTNVATDPWIWESHNQVTKDDPGQAIISEKIWVWFDNSDWFNGSYCSGYVEIDDATLTIDVKEGMTLLVDTITEC